MEIVAIFLTLFMFFFIFTFYLINEEKGLGFLLQLLTGIILALIGFKYGLSEDLALLGLGITLTLLYWMPK